MAKPFIAARIPEIIDEKLKAYAENVGASRTDIVISALAQYLGCSIEVPVETNAVDRLAALEKRVEVLEMQAGKPLQSKLDLVISDDEEDDNNDTGSDSGLLTTKEVAGLTGKSDASVRGLYRRKQVIKFEGKQFEPVSEGSNPRWRVADNSID